MPASQWATAQRARGLLLYSCLFLLLPTRTSAAPLTEANAKWNVNLEERHAPESYRGEWRNHTYFPSPDDWRSLSIYQLITDRFADGEPRNNDLYQGGFDVRDMTYRHGGDFLGLTQKLPYIKGMGCQAIWISPIFQNGFNSYHQYSQTDFTLLDQRLGTLDELRQLADSAHRLGMYVIVDVVMNHMGNEFFFEGHQGESAPFRIHEEGSRHEYHLRPRRSNSDLHWTPAGRQPYIDFWYNNTWDADASYPGTLYGQHGEPVEDQGRGTYSSSDFHHNGDLQDYYDPFQIHFGKLYGTMDDLRLEHARVQQKYIAMSKALISSCDIDGFRVDTPMQVPLNFYKAWAPAVREHAKSLGKASFGLFGEFYVTPERYATMTGRGRDRNMYGTDRFIDGPATMKGGIVYSYYWYMFTAFVYSQPQYADGFALAYAEERSMIDVYDPANARHEYAMWNFCNNHDNWRLQSMTSTRHLHVCLVVITFWPGIPLHYAGDEQNFDSPGSALDGWAREELGASLAWQAVPTHQSGNVASRDNFDMTSGNYLFIARLNALRRAHFGSFGSEECDKLMTPDPPIQDVLAFIRGCSEEQRVAVLANFHSTETREALLWSPWQEHTELQDIIATSGQLRIVVGAGGRLQTSLPPLAAVALVPGPRRSIPPSVVAVSPSHAAVLSGPAGTVQIVLSFDQPMHSSAADGVSLDGFAGMFSCMTANCTKVAATMLFETFCDGVHVVEALEGLQSFLGLGSFSSFRSTFTVDRHRGIIARPHMHEWPGLICNRGRALCHNAAGAEWLRIKNVGGNWTAWRPYEAQSEWQSFGGVGVLVQYHAEGSSSYIAGDCLVRGLLRCYSTWHKQMHLRGEFNDWGQDSDLDMVPVDHFTWAANLSVDRFLRAKFAPGRGWEKSYGIHPTRKLLYGLPLFDPRSKDFEVEPYMSGAAASRRWMVERGRWSAHESITTSADFAADIWISHRCTPEPPPCEPPEASEVGWKCHSYRSGEDFAWCASAGTQGCVMFAPRNASEDMASCGTCDCCRKQVAVLPKGDRRQCCILFNDLLLNYTITDDLSRCVARGASPAPSWTLSSETSFQDARGSRCTDAGGSREVDKAASQTIMPTEASERGDELLAAWVPSQWKTALGLSVFILMLIGLPFCHAPARLYLSIVRQSQAPLESPRPPVADKATEGSKRSKRHVVFASLEHNVPELNIRGFTGDAGIFLEDLAKEHPRGTISFIHPMLGGCDYGELAWFTDLSMLVDGKSYVAKVLRWESPKKEKGVKKVWYFVQHELFLERMQESIYPGPMSKLRVLRFFSLWNQAVALLLDALRPDVFNCLDCHQAMAPLYLSELHIPMVLMLRKPLEMGSVDSELICDRCWRTTIALRRLSVVFNLKLPTLRNFCTFEGRFNMMWAAVQRIKDCQSGRGLCVLSAATAASLRREHSLFQALQRKPRALGHPSRLVSLDVDSSVEDLKKQRASAKAALQRRAHLKEDPKARILLFAGPWAQHTGAAQVAEVLPLILVRHSSVQVALFGTCSDLHGVLAQDGLAQVVSSFPGRVAVLDRLDFRRGVDFLLAPFNAEPVGQQDVELGLVGVPTCGCAVGALGRIPGVYFRPQNSASTLSLASALFCALEYCLTMDEEEYWQLAKAATRTAQEGFGESFHHNLTEVYREVETAFQTPAKNWGGAGALLWETDASQEELHRAVRARRSTPLRRVSATADMANEMEVIDIFDDREFLTQPVSETKAHDIMKAVAEEVLVSSAPTESAVALQRDISQARQLREERDVVERCLMKPCAWNLCLRIHLVMALCYTTTACGELLLQSLEVEGVAGRLVPSAQLWSAYHAGEALGAVLWLTLSYGLPPNLLMATSQALGMASFLLLPLLPEHLLEAKWSILSFAAVSGVQGSSRLLFLIWNFNEELQHGFQVAIWRLGLLEGLRRSVAWLALMTSYAESLWIYKQVLFVVYFTALVLLFKAPYCYASYVLPITSVRAWLKKRSFLLLLASEVFISLGSYSAQDITQWWELNGRAPEEIQMFAFAMVVGLPLLLTILFSALRRLNVWGPWALRDFACLLPPGMLLRVLAVCDVRGHDRSELFVAALLAAAAVDAARYTAVLCAMMTVLGNKWYAMKGCFLAALLASISRAAAPRFQWWVASMAGSEPKPFAGLPDLSELGEMTLWAVLPPAFAGYVCQVLAVLFFNEDVVTFKGHGCYLADGSEGDLCTSMRKFWVAKVRHRMARASSALSRQKDALKEIPNQDEAAGASVLPSLLLSPRHGAGGSKHLCLSPKSDEEYSHQVHPSCGDDEDYDVPNEREGISELKSPRAEAEDAWKVGMPEKDTATTKSAVSFDVQTDFVTPSNKDSQGEEDKDGATTVSFALGTSFGQDEGTDAASEKELEFACDQGTPEKDPATTKSAVSFDVTPRSIDEDSQEAEKDMATTANLPSQNHSGDEENLDDEEHRHSLDACSDGDGDSEQVSL